MASELQTVREIIDALGGAGEIARLTDRETNHVVNWRNEGRFPAKTFLVITAALKERGHSAPIALWGMIEQQPREDQREAVR